MSSNSICFHHYTRFTRKLWTSKHQVLHRDRYAHLYENSLKIPFNFFSCFGTKMNLFSFHCKFSTNILKSPSEPQWMLSLASGPSYWYFHEIQTIVNSCIPRTFLELTMINFFSLKVYDDGPPWVLSSLVNVMADPFKKEEAGFHLGNGVCTIYSIGSMRRRCCETDQVKMWNPVIQQCCCIL